MFEKTWYEFSPFIYSIAAGFIVFYGNLLAKVFAILLLAVSLLISVMRMQSRSAAKVKAKIRNKASNRQYKHW
jgi:hypothetical protein